MLEGMANDQCLVDFMNVPVGTYHLIVSGQNFSNVDAGNVAMDTTGSQEFEVRVKRDNELNTPPVDSRSLIWPRTSRFRSVRRNSTKRTSWLRSKIPHAIERLNKALEVYPAYAGANNLAVIYARQATECGSVRRCRRRSASTIILFPRM
jgi:hypothetical protein